MLLLYNISYCRVFIHSSYTQFRKNSYSNLISTLKTMPKDKTHILEAQKQRIKIKEKTAKYVPAKVTLQVLGSGAEGAPRSIYIFSDQGRYLFNCGEGTQRLAHEHKMKLAKLEHIFITQAVWNNIGGLPGTALTIQDVGVPKITLHGPNGLMELFRATKKFVIMKNLKVDMANCEPSNSFKDNVMTVKYVPLLKVTKSLKDDDVEDENSAKNIQVNNSVSDTKDLMEQRKSKKNFENDNTASYYGYEKDDSNEISEDSRILLENNKDLGVVMSYVCRLKPRPGALDLEKCVEMGVPPGPLLGQLKSGKEINLQNGTTVKPTDVCEPDDPGPVFLVVDCPSDEYIESLINNDTLKTHQATAKKDEDMAYLIVHFTPQHVLANPLYKDWINQFSPSTQHLFINEGNVCLGSMAVHRIQHKLNLLSTKIFPLLGNNKLIAHDAKSNTIENINARIIQPNTFSMFHIRPKNGFDSLSEIKLEPSQYVAETFALEGFQDELEKLKSVLEEKRKDVIMRPYPKVLFLGTGSCIPNKTRNTSGILLQTSETSNILIDCGEGTYGQIVRFYGDIQSKTILSNIDVAYISHLHADHHIGLIGLLQGRHRARRYLGLPHKPLYLLAPKQIQSWLSFYDMCFEDIDMEYELIPNSDLLMGNHKLDADKKRDIFEALNMHDINTCYVKHCLNSFGVSFHHQLGKITYSGDTMPCQALVLLGMDSDLLIHEATMEDDLAEEAIIKMHSTTSQAITIGQQMKAKSIILTHFSQRYAKLPRFNDNFTDNIGIAFDNMMITLDELPLLPLFYPALKLMFAEHYEEMAMKAIKRQRKQQRELMENTESSDDN